MNDQIEATVNVDVYAVEVDGSRTLVGQGRNRVVDSGISALLTMLLGNPNDEFTQGFRYTEVGTGSAAVTAGDLALDEVLARGEIRTGDARASGNVVAMETFFVFTAVSEHLREAGLWIGDAATTALGTGTLFARTTLNVDNRVARKDIVLAWRIRFAVPVVAP